MSKNKSASAQAAQITKAVEPAKKAEKKERFIVRAEFSIGDYEYKPGDVFNVPKDWTRNLHQESTLNPRQKGKSFCFDEVIMRDTKPDVNTGKASNEAVRTCTHVLPLTLEA